MRRTAPLILGAGPAGCAAAITLARRGIRPVVLDRDEYPRDQLCGGFLSWRTVAQLRGLNVDIPDLGGVPVQQMRVFVGPHQATAALPEICYGLSRRALDGALRGAAIATGAQLEHDTARAISGLTITGSKRSWSGDGLFLASGKHDVRGMPRNRRSRDASLGMRLRLPSCIARSVLLAGKIELHLFDGGYAGIVLQEDGSANVCLAVRKSVLIRAGGNPSALLDQLVNTHPAFAQRLQNDWRGLHIEAIGSIPYGWIARATEHGVFRLGDQGAVIPSLAGEGISIALASGSAAAEHWLRAGPAGAASYQRAMAERCLGPIRWASLASTLAQGPVTAKFGLILARHFPSLLPFLMAASRIRPEP